MAVVLGVCVRCVAVVSGTAILVCLLQCNITAVRKQRASKSCTSAVQSSVCMHKGTLLHTVPTRVPCMSPNA
jgi:hypothetical protein